MKAFKLMVIVCTYRIVRNLITQLILTVFRVHRVPVDFMRVPADQYKCTSLLYEPYWTLNLDKTINQEFLYFKFYSH